MVTHGAEEATLAQPKDDDTGALLEARDLVLHYGPSRALNGASLQVSEGEIVALTGRSGSGKSSFLHCLAGVLRPDQGVITFRAKRLDSLPDDEISKIRCRNFGFVFQFGELVPELTLLENVALPLRLNGTSRRPSIECATEYLDVLGIGDEAAKHPAEVSGGQAQRAAIARALVHHPGVVFADEPTGALDTDNKRTVLEVFESAVRKAGTALVMVTHEDDVAQIADSHYRMVDGTIERLS